MRGVAIVLALGLLGATVVARPRDASATPLRSQSCGATTVEPVGPLPGWTAPADPPGGVPSALTEHHDAAAVLFGAPLRAGHPTGHTDKILWIVRQPRDRQPLRVTARPLHGHAPSVRVVQAADAGPGEIYPSVVDVPRSGCWHLTLEWNGHRDTIDLRYQ